jgi:hypothetical protein
MDQAIADRLARIEQRLEHLALHTDAPGTSHVDRICTPGRNLADRLGALQAQLGDLAQGQLWLLSRFRAPMSYIDKGHGRRVAGASNRPVPRSRRAAATFAPARQ